MIVASKLTHSIMIGGVVVKGLARAFDPGAPEPSYIVYGWAISADIPDAAWEAWVASTPLSARFNLVFGDPDMQKVRQFAYQNRRAVNPLANGVGQP
jgi:hypothetical protein